MELEEEEKETEEKEENSENIHSESEGEESPFSHPLLKGKTPAEIEAIVTSSLAAVKEQGSRLTQVESDLANARREPVRENKVEKVTSEKFFEDPDAAIGDIVARQMEKIMSPFKEDLARTRVKGVWDELESQYPDSKHYRDLMKTMLNNLNITAPTLETLEHFYYTAKGKAASEGRNIEEREEEVGEKKPEKRRMPPQHSPSGQPIPRGQGNNKVRKLTENERTIAKMQGFPDSAEGHAEFLKWLDADEGDVINIKEVKKNG